MRMSSNFSGNLATAVLKATSQLGRHTPVEFSEVKQRVHGIAESVRNSLDCELHSEQELLEMIKTRYEHYFGRERYPRNPHVLLGDDAISIAESDRSYQFRTVETANWDDKVIEILAEHLSVEAQEFMLKCFVAERELAEEGVRPTAEELSRKMGISFNQYRCKRQRLLHASRKILSKYGYAIAFDEEDEPFG